VCEGKYIKNVDVEWFMFVDTINNENLRGLQWISYG